MKEILFEEQKHMRIVDDFINEFIEGKPSAFKKIYARSFPFVQKWISQRDGNSSDAEDVFQSALTLMFVKLKNNEIEVKDFEGYLFTICKNLWRKEIVQRNRVTNTEHFPLVNEEDEKARFYLEQKQWELYQEKFELLSENCKEILKMTFQKIPYEKIVEHYSYSSETVARQRVFKCKKRLSDWIASDTRFQQLKK